jgi:hypothetical protein
MSTIEMCVFFTVLSVFGLLWVVFVIGKMILHRSCEREIMVEISREIVDMKKDINKLKENNNP